MFCNAEGIVLPPCMPSGGSAQVKWEVPYNHGGLPITSYVVEYRKTVSFPSLLKLSVHNINTSKTEIKVVTMRDAPISANIDGYFNSEAIAAALKSELETSTNSTITANVTVRDLDPQMLISEVALQESTLDVSLSTSPNALIIIANVSNSKPPIITAINHGLDDGVRYQISDIVAPREYYSRLLRPTTRQKLYALLLLVMVTAIVKHAVKMVSIGRITQLWRRT